MMKSTTVPHSVRAAALMAAFSLGGPSAILWGSGSEHPSSGSEHPAAGSEHPAKGSEHPATGEHAPASVSLEEVAAFIEAHVQTASPDGTVNIRDKKAGKDLVLTLDKVHRERLSRIAPATYFVCADFKTAEGKVYDLDFFVKGTDKENLKIVSNKTSVHKEEGKARYSWKLDEASGIWKKEKNKEQHGGAGKKKEHPEHPEHPK